MGGGGGGQNKLGVLVYTNMAIREGSSQIVQNDHQLLNISSFCWLNDLPFLHFLALFSTYACT